MTKQHEKMFIKLNSLLYIFNTKIFETLCQYESKQSSWKSSLSSISYRQKFIFVFFSHSYLKTYPQFFWDLCFLLLTFVWLNFFKLHFTRFFWRFIQFRIFALTSLSNSTKNVTSITINHFNQQFDCHLT